MQIIKSLPTNDGYRMPGEFEPHRATILIWPTRPGSWTNHGVEAQKTFCEIARAIAESSDASASLPEEVYLLTESEEYEVVSKIFEKERSKIHVLQISSDDAWARDVGPTFVVNDEGKVRGINWKFNAWGGEYDGLYANYDRDDKVAGAFCEALGYEMYDASDFVLEGGSIHSDGEGTLLVTESCLLSPGRNPELSKAQIETRLKECLGISKVIWLPRGIAGDETNEHVDNMCAFVRPGEVVLAWTDDEKDIQWVPSHETLRCLEEETDAKGRHFKIHKLPIPKKPVCITSEELAAMEFEEGEDTRESGERLAASYVNFYISNNAVLVPQFGEGNEESDATAVRILKALFENEGGLSDKAELNDEDGLRDECELRGEAGRNDKEPREGENKRSGRLVVPIMARAIIVGGGNIHCITQQVPLGNSRFKM